MSHLIIVTPRDPTTGVDAEPVGINADDVSGFITIEVPTTNLDKDGKSLKIVFTRMTYRAGVAGNPASVKETPVEIAKLSA